MGVKKLRSNALNDRETVRWTVSTFLQRSEATAIKSLTFSAPIEAIVHLDGRFYFVLFSLFTSPISLRFARLLGRDTRYENSPPDCFQQRSTYSAPEKEFVLLDGLFFFCFWDSNQKWQSRRALPVADEVRRSLAKSSAGCERNVSRQTSTTRGSKPLRLLPHIKRAKKLHPLGCAP